MNNKITDSDVEGISRHATFAVRLVVAIYFATVSVGFIASYLLRRTL